MHELAYPVGVLAFPLTVDIIANVASLFKKGRYASYKNYVGRAKAEHIATQHIHCVSWSDQLAEEVRQSINSCDRGLGPTRQSRPIDIARVAELAPVLERIPIQCLFTKRPHVTDRDGVAVPPVALVAGIVLRAPPVMKLRPQPIQALAQASLRGVRGNENDSI